MPTKNSTKKPKLILSVQYAFKPEGVPTRAQFRLWAQGTLERDVEVAIRIVDGDEGQELNRDYRGKDYATNVLTFVYDDLPPEAGLMGDLVLCAPVVEKEAREQGISLEAHYAHLTVHGVLHLQGYDHEDDAEAQIMENLESRIVMNFGYADPYGAEK